MNGKLEIQRQCKISTIRLQEDDSAAYLGRIEFYQFQWDPVPIVMGDSGCSYQTQRIKQGTLTHFSNSIWQNYISVKISFDLKTQTKQKGQHPYNNKS
jgi:hypothetical protein